MFHLLHPVFLISEHLHPDCRPAHVFRKHGITILFVHSKSLKAEVAMWSLDNLTKPERLTIREAYQHPLDLTKPLHDDAMDGEIGLDVPLELQLPAWVSGLASA